MTPDIHNKIDLEAKKYIGDPYSKSEHRTFKHGASFVAGILQPEIERLEELRKSDLWKIGQGIIERDVTIQSLKAKIEELEGLKSLKTIRNQERAIQSLKDENKKFREALEFYANGGNPNRDIWFDEKLGYFTGKRARQTLDGVSK